MYSAQVQQASNLNPQYAANGFDKSNIRYELLRNVAISTFKEIALSAAMTSLTCCFVASTSIPLLVTSAVTIIGLNVIFRISEAYLLYKLHQHEQSETTNEMSLKWLKRSISFTQWLCPCNFALLDFITTGMLVHETGHALAALTVYENSKPVIKIIPWVDAFTRYSNLSLTLFGGLLGEKNSFIAVTAGGPALGIITATIQIIFSHRIKKEHPEASKMLLVPALASIGSHSLHAISALWQTRKNPGHDFLQLWSVAKIHPIVSVISMLALSIIAKTILVLNDRNHSQKSSVE